jgi:hypothetical protein
MSLDLIAYAFSFFALGFGVATIIWQAMFWEIRNQEQKQEWKRKVSLIQKGGDE